MFIIYESNKKMYMRKNHKEVIVFDDEQKSKLFINAFYNNYALPIAMGSVFEEGPGLMQDVVGSSQVIQVIEMPNDFKEPTVNFENLMKK